MGHDISSTVAAALRSLAWRLLHGRALRAVVVLCLFSAFFALPGRAAENPPPAASGAPVAPVSAAGLKAIVTRAGGNVLQVYISNNTFWGDVLVLKEAQQTGPSSKYTIQGRVHSSLDRNMGFFGYYRCVNWGASKVPNPAVGSIAANTLSDCDWGPPPKPTKATLTFTTNVKYPENGKILVCGSSDDVATWPCVPAQWCDDQSSTGAGHSPTTIRRCWEGTVHGEKHWRGGGVTLFVNHKPQVYQSRLDCTEDLAFNRDGTMKSSEGYDSLYVSLTAGSSGFHTLTLTQITSGTKVTGMTIGGVTAKVDPDGAVHIKVPQVNVQVSVHTKSYVVDPKGNVIGQQGFSNSLTEAHCMPVVFDGPDLQGHFGPELDPHPASGEHPPGTIYITWDLHRVPGCPCSS